MDPSTSAAPHVHYPSPSSFDVPSAMEPYPSERSHVTTRQTSPLLRGTETPPNTSSRADASSSRTPDSQRMQRLLLEYEKGGEDNVESTAQGSQLLSLWMELEDKDVLDRGEIRPPRVSRYALEPMLLKRVERIAYELQHFLQRASAMVPGRARFFRIDPEDAILSTLKGSSSVAQLFAAWELMRKRLELGRGFLGKYVREFKNPDFIEDFSPASTAKELSEELRVRPDDESQIRFMMAYYPHHNEKLVSHKDRLRVTTADWETALKLSRGEQDEETMHTYEDYYQTQPDDTSELFDHEEEHTIREGKQREVELEERARIVEVNTYSDPLRAPLVPSEPTPAPAIIAPSIAFMAPATPFKTQQQFMTGLIAKDVAVPSTSGTEPEPNILKRLGVGPMSAVGSTFLSFVNSADANRTKSGIPSSKLRSIPLQPRPSNPFEHPFVVTQPEAFSTPSVPPPLMSEKSAGKPAEAMGMGEVEMTEEVVALDRDLLGRVEEADRVLHRTVEEGMVETLDLRAHLVLLTPEGEEEEVEEALRDQRDRPGRPDHLDPQVILALPGHQGLLEEEDLILMFSLQHPMMCPYLP
ncbi:hypothetical protein B0H13DRAFT_2315828 [Mycena leptocephala]|nr:hypothetical protein B0H13DRAFT_2315828 [Mycena leptocephala]